MHNMRKRRLPASSFQDALQTLRSTVTSAANAQKILPESHDMDAPFPPILPVEFSKLNDTKSLDKFSDSELQRLQERIPTLLQTTSQQRDQWEDLKKQLRNALDAVLLVIALKSELGPLNQLKRRRGGAQSPPPPNEIENDQAADDKLGVNPEDSDNLSDFSKPNVDLASVPAKDIPELNAAGKLSALNVGQAVAFKVPKSAVDEWIQCEITRVLVPNSRFEVRDPEPDDDGNPGKTYSARLRDIMPLPRADQPLKPLAVGSVVFARYPDTTAFYKARVTRYSPKKRVYYLRFEGEDDVQKEIEVSDLLVIPARNRR